MQIRERAEENKLKHAWNNKTETRWNVTGGRTGQNNAGQRTVLDRAKQNRLSTKQLLARELIWLTCKYTCVYINSS